MLSVRNTILVLLTLMPAFQAGCTNRSTNISKPSLEEQRVEVSVQGPLKVVVLDTPEVSQAIRREWTAQSDHEVTVMDDSEAEFLNRLRSTKSTKSIEADVIVFPSPLLGELVERQVLRTLPSALTSTSSEEAVSGYHLADVFKGVVRKEMRWDGRQMAVTLGSPVPLLLVREDLVSQVPQTWAELQDYLANSPEFPAGVRPLAEPLGPGWAARMFLTRAASYLYEQSRVSEFFDYSNMRPRITLEPCQRALREMVAAYDPANEAMDPAGAYEAWIQGKAAMALAWPDPLDQGQPPEFPIALHPLPGASQVYDVRKQQWEDLPEQQGVRRIFVLGHSGRLAAIVRRGKNVQLASLFLGWIGGREQAFEVASRSQSSAPFRKSHRGRERAWCGGSLTVSHGDQYGENLQSALSSLESMSSIRVPGYDRYLDALDREVRAALHGEKAVAQALESASQAWEVITEEIGREQQTQAYRRSLGIRIE